MSIYKILYGANETFLDVTTIVLQQLTGLNEKGHLVATIPATDHQRCLLFTDPLYGTLKTVHIYKDNKLWKIVDHTETFEIPIYASIPHSLAQASNLLTSIHRRVHFYGNLDAELPEQFMICRFLPPTAKVLEIGTNIGRSSIVIASILEDDSQFVTLETCETDAYHACVNRDANGKKFHIVNAALSLRPLYQSGMTCYTEPKENAVSVRTCTLDDLHQQYNIVFDTLILDCEGAFYDILHDFPTILDNIRLIIIENDYNCNHKKSVVNDFFTKHNFSCVYRELLDSSPHPEPRPCNDCFFEVWQRF